MGIFSNYSYIRVILTVMTWLHLQFSRVFAIQLARMAEQHALTITSGGDVTTTRSCDNGFIFTSINRRATKLGRMVNHNPMTSFCK